MLNTCRSKFTQFLLFYTAHTAQAQPNASAAAGARCAESLVQLLLARLRDGRQPPITRSACAAYLASFLARAAFCPPVLVVGALQELVAFCMQYAQQQAVQCSAPSVGMSHSSSTSALANMSSSMLRVSSNNCLVASNSVPPPSPSHANAADAAMRHPVLYASVQAVLYVLCYHLERLVTLGRTASADTISKQVAQVRKLQEVT